MQEFGPQNQLPHDLLSEKALISCLVIDGQSFDEVRDLELEKDDFYHPQFGIIFDAIAELANSDSAIDFITLSAVLKERGHLEGLGGQEALLEISEDQASSANVFHYAKTVKEKSTLRRVIRTASKVIEKGTQHKGKVADFIAEVESDFFKLTSQSKKSGLESIRTFLKQNLTDLQNEDRKKGEISGLPTGFHRLDEMLLGMQAGQLIILAARPAMGKTSLALNLAVNTCKATHLPVAIFSLEMVAAELSMRVLSSEAGVDSSRLRTKDFLDTDLRKMGKSVQELSQLPLFINDSAGSGLLDIKSQCRKIKLENGLGLIIIDYLQLMQSHNKLLSREQQISEISRGLKELAKELGCPVIALSQLNRSLESRPDKRPMPSDLRESGAIEQDADIILFVYRDEVYNKESKDKGIAEVIIGKNRAGETGTAKLAWIGSQTKFGNLAYDPQSQEVSH